MPVFDKNTSQSYRERKLGISTEPTKTRPPNQIKSLMPPEKKCSELIQGTYK